MVNRALFLLLTGGILYFHSSFVEAFCQPTEKWREQNDRGNRYEGTITLEVGAPTLELIALFSFREEYKANDTLKVRFFLPDISFVNLSAQELETRQFYWMETKPQQWKLGWNEFGSWPVSEVLWPLEVPSENLGVLVKMDRSRGSGLVSPAILYHSAAPSEISRYVAYFRSGKSLGGGKYSIFMETEQNRPISQGSIGRQSIGVPFPVIFSLPNDLKGLVRLKVEVKSRNTVDRIPITYEYTFYHISAVGSLGSQ